jgi:malate dehydrogenase (oxaloacetate-decarboxylating)
VAKNEALREITIEVRDKAHAEQLAVGLGELEGVTVSWFHDRAFIAHDGGKLDVVSRREIRTNQDVRDVYTPGVARVSLAISEFPELAARFTMIGRSVAIVTNGTRVLGLGDIGPVAAMPVMEGKALFYAQLVGISAVPILIDTKDVDEFVETVVRIAPGFGAIHLEDISTPACFEIERRLIEALPQPVMHDDVHGTAVVTFAAAIAACRHVGMRLDEAVVGQIGLGAAGYGIASLIHDAGCRVIASCARPTSSWPPAAAPASSAPTSSATARSSSRSRTPSPRSRPTPPWPPAPPSPPTAPASTTSSATPASSTAPCWRAPARSTSR